MNEKDRRGLTASSQRPRSPRVPVEFGLEVVGSDESGKPFHVKAQAIKISRGGATIILDVEVPVGSTVKLIPPFGRNLEAQVNGSWTDEMDGRKRIGVKLLDADGWFAE
jgi:PilZ domain